VGRRGRSRQRSFEYISGRSLFASSCLPDRGCEIGEETAPQNVSTLQRFVHRAESGAGKNSARLARRNVGGMQVAVMRNDSGQPGASAQNARDLRRRAMKAAPRVLLVGAAGRMGKTIVDLAKSDPNIQIVAQCDLGDAIEPAMKDCDVVIDFSHVDVVDEICRTALRYRKSLVIGTTGHSKEQRQIIEETAQSLPIVFASN